MQRSPLTATLRAYPRGHRRLAIYYVDIFGDALFVESCEASSVQEFAKRFAKNNGFDAFEIQFGSLGAKWSGETD